MAGEIAFFALIIVGFLIGLRLQQSPETAVWGNRLAALSMAAAIVFTTYLVGIFNDPVIWAILIGTSLVGIFAASRVRMIQMPQTVALLNGFGGVASAFVAGTSALYDIEVAFAWFTAGLALAVGTFTFSGSVVAALKLQDMITQRSVRVKGQRVYQMLLLALLAALVVLLTATGSSYLALAAPVIILAAAVYGIMISMRVGGADMPVIISLLNSFSGIAASISGFAVDNVLLVSAGAVVGVTGLILTRIMCVAMNRSLMTVLRGISPEDQGKKETAERETAEKEEIDEVEETAAEEPAADSLEDLEPEDRISALIEEAEDIIIVPGYGMAVAQAQQSVKDLMDRLEAEGKHVDVAIHPVAGRMPGHMNVLLAEVGVPHDKLKDLEDINDQFADTDLALVVGACDVVNPAAKKADGSPISGMPVLNAEEADNVAVLNLDSEPGYSGVENTLYEEDHVITYWGDAAETVPGLLEKLRAREQEKAGPAEESGQEAISEDLPEFEISRKIQEAEDIIIVPGYGMAVAQAQQSVKDLMDRLEAEGKHVDVAIHPVAGRMPGHMNVLLAEVGVPHDKLKDLEDINDQFADTDLALVVGACDVVNPAAKKADGSPISGMPVLNAEEAENVAVLNLDSEPGYSGVENTLYEEDHVITYWGDAAETVPRLIEVLDSDSEDMVGKTSTAETEEASAGDEDDPESIIPSLIDEAEDIIIVPGYGMAVAQAQQSVKDLMDRMEAEGKHVDVAIHPVAGRMPGHMNVLLAEVGVPHDKLKDLEDINDQFADTDLALVVGACDVVNPAAKKADGSPISGMPVLNAEEAENVVVLNLDSEPGYSGVENTLYEEDHVITYWGDAAETVPRIIELLRS